MGKARYVAEDFLTAALSIAAARGPTAITVGSITDRLHAPTGSFYHRFTSRDFLLAKLWLRVSGEFLTGIAAALDDGDPLRAALHTPVWAREHIDHGRLVFLHNRDDFVHGKGPDALHQQLQDELELQRGAIVRFAGLAFGSVAPGDLRRAEFLMLEVPRAAVSQHLRRHEPPPMIVDELITATFRAVVARRPEVAGGGTG